MSKTNSPVWIVAAKRTPFGKFNGAFKKLSATDLGVLAAEAALEQSGIDPSAVDHVVVGNVQQTSPDAAYIARHVGLRAGLPIETPALVINRLCGSGFQALATASEQILLGRSRAVLAVGTESMSQAPHVIYGLRDGQKFGRPPEILDSLMDALTDRYAGLPMAVTAENLAGRYGIDRAAADRFALQSQQRWAAAHAAHVFDEELVPVTVGSGDRSHVVKTDEPPRPETTLERLATLPPAFTKNGLVTAGNASGIADGAAALVLVAEEFARAHGLTPLARLLDWSSVGVPPEVMGIGPAPAIRSVLKRLELQLSDVGLFDVNEAFAAQFLAVQKELDLPDDRTNLHGGAIALGHPLGASGARIAANLMYTLRRTQRALGVASACIGGGQGIAVVLEAM